MKIWGRIVDKNKIIKDKVVELEEGENYQESLKKCIYKICCDFDMERPYWLPSNVDEYNTRKKTIFTSDNFIDEFAFDKFVIEEIKEK